MFERGKVLSRISNVGWWLTLATPTCFPVQPSHALAVKQAPAFVSEGSRGAWTRCVAGAVAGDQPTLCGSDKDLTVCSSKDGSLWATRWVGQKAEVLYASKDQEPVRIGYVEERSRVSALFRHGKKTYRCEVELKAGRMVVEWRKL